MKKVVSIFCIAFFFVLCAGFCPNNPEEPDIMISVHQKGGKIIRNTLSNDYGKVGFKKTVLKIDTDSISYYYYSVRCSGKGFNTCPPIPKINEIKAMLNLKKQQKDSLPSK
jgi:hypothetical protein